MGNADPNKPTVSFFKTTIIYAIWRCVVEWSFAPLADYVEREWGTVINTAKNATGICLIFAVICFVIGYAWKAHKVEPVIAGYSTTNATLSGQILQLSSDVQRLEGKLENTQRDFGEQVANLKSDYNERLREKDAEIARVTGERDAALIRANQWETAPTTAMSMYMSASNILSEVKSAANQSQMESSKLTNIEERTSDIERLPDGRTMFGGVLAGSPKIVLESVQAGILCVSNRNLLGALHNFQRAVTAYESTSPSGVMIDTSKSLTPDGKRMIYLDAAIAAGALGSNDMANEYAKKADNIAPSWQTKLVLAVSLSQLAVTAYRTNAITNSFKLFQSAVTNLENISKTNKDLLPKTNIAEIYAGAAQAAFRIGKTNEAMKFGFQAAQILGLTNNTPHAP